MIKDKYDRIRFFASIQWLTIGIIAIGNAFYYLTNYIVDTVTDPYATFTPVMIIIHSATLIFGIFNFKAGYRFLRKRSFGYLLGLMCSGLTTFFTLLFVAIVSYESGLLRWLLVLLIMILSAISFGLLMKNKEQLK